MALEARTERPDSDQVTKETIDTLEYGDKIPKPSPPKKKPVKLTQEEKDRRAAERDALREHRKAERAEEREQKKRETAERKVREKAELKAARIAEAEEGHVTLPAVVLRDKTVKAIDPATAVEIISQYLGGLCLDVEHSGYDLGHQHYELRTVQLGGEDMAVVLDAADENQMLIASWALEAATKVHAHSASADADPCARAGLISFDDIWAKMYDSVLYAKLTDPKLSGSDANGLKDLARDLLGDYALAPECEKAKNALFKAMGCKIETDALTPPEHNGWYMVDKTSVNMVRYAGSDVLDLAAVLRVLPPLPVEESVLDRERRAEAVCARVNLDGAALDPPHIKKMIDQHEMSRETHRFNVLVLSDNTIDNPSSPDVGEKLIALDPSLLNVLERSEKTGRPSAARASLEKISDVQEYDTLTEVTLKEHSSPLQYEVNNSEVIRQKPESYMLAREILAYRHDVTTLGLLLRPLNTLCDEGDGRMRPTVLTINADTGRMSTVRPNSQQFSRQGGVRACVKADPGMKGIAADFSGCEILVAAALSGDRGLYEAEMSPRCWACGSNPCDSNCGKGHSGLHWRTAHTARGEAATKEDRYNAKRGTFTRLFGGGPATAAKQVNSPVHVMEELFAAFDESAPDFTAWDNWMRKCYYDGSLVWRDYGTGENYRQDIPGSRRMTYRTYSGRNIYVNAPHAAVNYAVQGTARELLVDALLEWAKGPWGHCVIIPIHDELVAFVPEAEAEEATKFLVKCMTTSILSVPGWDVLIGAEPDEPWTSWPDSS